MMGLVPHTYDMENFASASLTEQWDAESYKRQVFSPEQCNEDQPHDTNDSNEFTDFLCNLLDEHQELDPLEPLRKKEVISEQETKENCLLTQSQPHSQTKKSKKFSESERKQRRKESNRKAAQKFRNKKKDEVKKIENVNILKKF